MSTKEDKIKRVTDINIEILRLENMRFDLSHTTISSKIEIHTNNKGIFQLHSDKKIFYNLSTMKLIY